MNTHFEQKLLHKALNYKFNEVHGSILERAVEEMATQENPPIKLKNICAYVPETFAKRLEDMLDLLKMSKREFVTLALHEALDKADKIIEEVNIYEEDDARSQEVL